VERFAPYTAQVAMWWLYFKWQWLRDPSGRSPAIQTAVALLFLGLGLLGGYVHWATSRKTFAYFAPLMFTLTLALIYYMDFKYGWSQSPELGAAVDREVRDRDYFYIWSFSTWGIWAALGLSYMWRRALEQLRQTHPPKRALMLSVPILLVAAVPFFSNYSATDHRGDTFTRDFAVDMLNSVEPYGILITNGDNDTVPLWYAQEVEGVRQDVMVLVGMHLNTDWFVRQIIRRPVRTYDQRHGPAVYSGRTWEKPTHAPLRMTFEEADAIPAYVEIREPQLFTKGEITARINPGYLMRDQLVTLQLIKDSFPERPIYFPVANNMRQLGFDNYLVTQGLVERLVDHSVVPDLNTVRVFDRFVDVKRTRALWKEYLAPDSLARMGRWIDQASINVPRTYIYAGMQAREALIRAGDRDSANAIARRISEVARVTKVPEIVDELAAPR
jgi:hypothetical protein